MHCHLMTGFNIGALYCPSNHSDIIANVIEILIKHFMRAREQLRENTRVLMGII